MLLTAKKKEEKLCFYIYLLFFFFASTNLYAQERTEFLHSCSTPKELAVFSSLDELVGGIVSPLTGLPYVKHEDLVVKGAQDIALTRLFIPINLPCSFDDRKDLNEASLYAYLAKHYKGWVFFPQRFLKFNRNMYGVQFNDPNGNTLAFSPLNLKDPSVFKFSGPHIGVSNVCRGQPSGKYDLRNTRIIVQNDFKTVIVKSPDGIQRHYASADGNHFLLQREIYTNGKRLKFYYDTQNQLTRIESLDPQERYVYACVDAIGSAENGPLQFSSNASQAATYYYQNIKKHIETRKKRVTVKYDVTLSPVLICAESTPYHHKESMTYSDQLLLTEHSSKQQLFSCEYGGVENEDQVSEYRIKTLSLVDPLHSLKSQYFFNYRPQEGITTVQNPDGSEVHYFYSDQLLPTMIRYYNSNGVATKTSLMEWDENNWLQSVELIDIEKLTSFKKSYTYDCFGNPVTETGMSYSIDNSEHSQSYTIWREFSNDGLHRLLKEVHEDGSSTYFKYLPQTDLITAKYIKDKDKILTREFYEYDDSNNLIKTMIDDGQTEGKEDLSKITQRTITLIHLRQQPPFLHMPEWIEEKCVIKDAEEKLLRKIHLLYGTYGNVVQKEVYEDDEQWGTAIKTEYFYDDAGRMIQTKITRGLEGEKQHVTTLTYTLTGEIASQTYPNQITIFYTYTPEGRLESVTSSDGEIRHRFLYNASGVLIEATDDIQQISVKRELDSFGHIVGETVSPGFQIRKTYDTAGRPLSVKIAEGGEVHYSYDPLYLRTIARISNSGEKLYTHFFEKYDLNGHLLEEKIISNLGTITHTYDAQGRQINIKAPYLTDTLSDNDQTKNPLTEQRREGANYNELGELISLESIVCTYDLNGNMITKTTPDATYRFSYDALNRLTKVTTNGTVVCFSYDPLGRCISKTVNKSFLRGWITSEIKENYIYDGLQEIGSFNQDGKLKEFRVMGQSSTVGIEIDGTLYAPLCDLQNNVRRLIRSSFNALSYSYEYTEYGEETQSATFEFNQNPWRFRSGRRHVEVGLISLDNRYYDPQLGTWITKQRCL